MRTEAGSDTVVVDSPVSLLFEVEPFGLNVTALEFPIELVFSGPNTIGPVAEGEEFRFSDFVQTEFTMTLFDTGYGASVTSPDTLLWGCITFGAVPWTARREVARLHFAPSDTGTITIDSAIVRGSHLSIHDAHAMWIPIEWQPKTLTVVSPCPVILTGDVNESGSIRTSDIIDMVGTMFKGGNRVQPCLAAGDVNCDGRFTAADLVYLVNLIFKSGPPPCNVCTLIWDGTWECE